MDEDKQEGQVEQAGQDVEVNVDTSETSGTTINVGDGEAAPAVPESAGNGTEGAGLTKKLGPTNPA